MKDELIRKRSEIYNNKFSPAGDSQKTIKKRDVVNLSGREEPTLSEQSTSRLENIFEPRVTERRTTPMSVTPLDSVSLTFQDNCVNSFESGNRDFIRLHFPNDNNTLLEVDNSEDNKRCNKKKIVKCILGTVLIGLVLVVNDFILVNYF